MWKCLNNNNHSWFLGYGSFTSDYKLVKVGLENLSKNHMADFH